MKQKDKKELTRRDIEAKIEAVGDYVKMEYLSRALKENIDFETRKFVMIKLASIYETKGMFTDAGRLMSSAGDLGATYEEKINSFMKSFEFFVKSGVYDEAETAFTKAISFANGMQKERIKAKKKDLYKMQVEMLVKKDKRKNAMLIYEKMLNLDYSPDEKKEIQKALLGLYEKLGKIREYYNLKKSIELS